MQRKEYDQRLFEALTASHYCGPETKIGKTYIGPLLCDECGKRRAFTFTESPRKILCNRAGCSANKSTGGISTAQVLGISFDWEKESRPTPKNPHRPAIDFLIMERCLPKEIVNGSGVEYRRIKRTGMSQAIGGCFWQLYDSEKKAWDNNSLNGRGFDNRMKSHNIGSWKGKYYRHKGTTYSTEQETWIAESPIDCQSLLAGGIQSIGLVSAGADPADFDLEGLDKKLVISPDNDPAGISMIKRWKSKYPDAVVLLPPPYMDWNDLLRQNRKNWSEYIKQHRDLFQFYGELSLAKSAKKYADLYYSFHKRVPGLFKHAGMTFFATLKTKGDDTTVNVERIGKFTFKVIAYFWDSTNQNAPECHYQIAIKRADSDCPVLVIATGKDLATISSLKGFLLSRAMVNFEGGSQAVTAMATQITTARNAPEVIKATMTGLHSKSGMYVFYSFALCPQGKILRPDKRGFYKINHREWITPADHAIEHSIAVSEQGLPIREIHHLVSEAWGPRGVSALAWCVASWFVSEIKKKIGFHPFLSLWGDVQASKTSLTIVLNQIQGFNTEGCPSGSMNSRAGLIRSIGRAANLFTSIIEGNDRDENNAFETSSILPLYNSNPLAIKALYSNDMQTRVIPFGGALMLSANNELFVSGT